MKTRLSFAVVLLFLFAVSTSWAGYVTASVGYGSGAGINAQQVPGEFTVPAGMKAVNLRYNFTNPKSGFSSTTLSKSNIYNVTTASYMVGPGGADPTELPAAHYKFVVGGSPGASGSLSYDLVPQ